jgi:hypothetical protein
VAPCKGEHASMLVTAPVFQADSGWLKTEARLNMNCGDGRLVAVGVTRACVCALGGVRAGRFD